MRIVGKVLAVCAIGLFALAVGARLLEYDPREPAPVTFTPDVRVTADSVRVRNTGRSDWTGVLVTVDDEYRCTAPSRIVGGGQIVVPLVDCGTYRPAQMRVRSVHIAATIDGQAVTATHAPR